MLRDTSSDRIEFYCTTCGERIQGTNEDALISSGVLHAGEMAEKYQSVIRHAPEDRVNQLVRRDCPECGLNYMTQLRLGDREAPILKCKCGYQPQLSD